VLGYSPTDADTDKVAGLWPCKGDWPALPYSALAWVVQLLRAQLALDLSAPFTVNLFVQLSVFPLKDCDRQQGDAAWRAAMLSSIQATCVLAAQWVPVAERAAQELAAGAAGAELWLTSSESVPASVLQALQQLECQQQVSAEDFVAEGGSWVKAAHSACCWLLGEVLGGMHSSSGGSGSAEAGDGGAHRSGGSYNRDGQLPDWQWLLGPAWPLSGAYLAAWANLLCEPDEFVGPHPAWVDTCGSPLQCVATLTSFCTDCIGDGALRHPRIWQECSSGWASGGCCGATHRELHERLSSALEPLRARLTEHKQRLAAQQGEQADAQEQQQVGSRMLAPLCEQLLLMHIKHARLHCLAGHSNCRLQHNGSPHTQQRAAAVQLRAEGASLLDKALQQVVSGALDLLTGTPAGAAGPPGTAAGLLQQQQQLVNSIAQLAVAVAAVCDLLLLEDDAELLHQASYAHPALAAAAAAAAGGGSRGAGAFLLWFVWSDLQLAGAHISSGQWQQAADVLESLVKIVGRRHHPPVQDSMPPGFTQAG
jgi:hypothetical protein